MENYEWIEIWAERAKECTMEARLRDLLHATITNLLAAWRRRDNTRFHGVRRFLYDHGFRFAYPDEEDDLSALLGAVYWSPPYPGSLKHWLEELWWDDDDLIQEVE